MSSSCDPEVLHRFRGLRDAVTAVAFAPQQRQIAAASKDKSVMLWTFKTQEDGAVNDFDPGKAFKFSGHQEAVNDVVSALAFLLVCVHF